MAAIEGPSRSRALFAATMLIGIASGCQYGASGVEFAPATPAVQPATTDPDKPSVGPWFVDRAPDFGMDVVTLCGSPDKPSVLHSLGSGSALFDADGDGDLDIFVAGGSKVEGGRVVCAGGPWMFRNDGPGRWTDVTGSSGLSWTGWAQGTSVADYDGDGDLDLFITNHGPDTLWQNQGGGTFQDVTALAGLAPPAEGPAEWGVAAAWGDYGGDGWLDILVVNYLTVDAIRPPPLHDYPGGVKVFQGPGMLTGQPDRLWRNRGDGTFEDMTDRAGVSRPEGRGMAAVSADFDDDGRLDIYVTEDAMPNTLWHNQAGGRFQDVALKAGVAVNGIGSSEGSMGVDVADLDLDGRLDLVYSNFRQEGGRACRNLGGLLFQDATNSTRIGPFSQQFVGWGLILADFDDDGWIDLFQVNGHVYPQTTDAPYHQPPLFLRNQGEAIFEIATAGWGPRLSEVRSGRSVASGDLDGDGDLDLVVTTIDGPLRVLINEGHLTHHAASLRLVGKAPNREAVGARLAIRVAGHTRAEVVRRSGGFLAASDNAIHVGMGREQAIDHVVVRWPDGSTSRHEQLPGDSRLTIRQDSNQVEAVPFSRDAPIEVVARRSPRQRKTP